MAFAVNSWSNEHLGILVRTVAKAETPEKGFKKVAELLPDRSVNAVALKYGRLQRKHQLHLYVDKEFAEAAGLTPPAKPEKKSELPTTSNTPRKGGRQKIDWAEAELNELMQIFARNPKLTKAIKEASQRFPDKAGTVQSRYYAIKAVGGLQAFLRGDKPAPAAPKQKKHGGAHNAFSDDELSLIFTEVDMAGHIQKGLKRARKILKHRTIASMEVKFYTLRQKTDIKKYIITDAAQLNDLRTRLQTGQPSKVVMSEAQLTQVANTALAPSPPTNNTAIQDSVLNILSNASISGFQIKKSKIIIYLS